MTFRLTSPAFDDGTRIPARFTCEGEDISPAFGWSEPPADTQSFVLLCDDPDAPGGTWHHWALYDVPASMRQLDPAIPGQREAAGGRQGVNDFGRVGYGGPCPPPGHGTHHYRFRLLALDLAKLPLEAEADCTQVETATRPHILGEALLVGTYSR